MTTTTTETENKTDWEAKDLPRTSPLPKPSKSSQSAGKWTTRWHGLDNEQGILVERGNVKIALYSNQWAIYNRSSAGKRWEPLSYHLQCDSLLRTLREREAHGKTENPWDYEAAGKALSVMTNKDGC